MSPKITPWAYEDLKRHNWNELQREEARERARRATDRALMVLAVALLIPGALLLATQVTSDRPSYALVALGMACAVGCLVAVSRMGDS